MTSSRSDTKAPEVPINLRILAESILRQHKLGRMKTQSPESEKGFTIIDLKEAESW
jgi:hypothetical protein